MRLRDLLSIILIASFPSLALAQNPVSWQLEASTSTQKTTPGTAATAGTAKATSVATSTDATLTLNATIESGWHLYALTGPPSGPQLLVIAPVKGDPFTLVDATPTTPALTKFDTNFNLETQYHETAASFVLALRPTTAGATPTRVIVTYQVCNDRFCLPPRDQVVATGTPGTSGTAGSTGYTGAAGTSGTNGYPGTTGTTPSGVIDMAATSGASTLGAYVGLAALMGALSLLTPCVFPMIPITVSYFTARAGRSRREATMQALVYGLGIVLTFTAVGFTLAVVFGASGLNRFAADPWLNLGVTALFVTFALSLFGVWELALPSTWLTKASKADAGRGRIVGTLLMGLAFTLTSFTCTAPFLGTLLVVASQGDWAWPLAGMLAFSSVFALPFVALALAPQIVASLPRSGPWLISVKATMGLLELAAAVKFLSNVDLVWGWGLLTRPVVLTIWITLAVILTGYLLGWLKLGHASRLKSPGIARLSAAAVGVVLALWMASGIGGRRLGELEAFLPPADLRGGIGGSELQWIVNDYDAALARARAESRPILIDFTGYTCTNCRWMEANMFPDRTVAAQLARYVRVRLYTDGRGEPYRTYQDMEQNLFGTVALPYYAVMTPEGKPVVAFGGLTRTPAEFVAFLRRGLE